MKTRLLKRLRKKAQKRYWIEYHKEYDVEPYHIYDLQHYIGPFNSIWVKASCKDLESAKRECDNLRREYILGMVEKMRPRGSQKNILT